MPKITAPIPKDNYLLNLMWVGNKPLPDDHIVTLNAYSSPGILPVILWADHPRRLDEQISRKIGNSLLASGRLQIRPVSELFIPNEQLSPLHSNTTLLTTTLAAYAASATDLVKKHLLRHVAVKDEILMDALQQREQLGAGNIGARVDTIRAQILFRAGGIIADFDTLRNMSRSRDGEKNNLRNFRVLIDISKRGNILLCRAKQPDFMVGLRGSPDSNIMRESIIRLAKLNAATAYTGEIDGMVNDRFVFKRLDRHQVLNNRWIPLHSADPLYHLLDNALSQRDKRRSYNAWQEKNAAGANIAKKLTLVDSGAATMYFPIFKFYNTFKPGQDPVATEENPKVTEALEAGIDRHDVELVLPEGFLPTVYTSSWVTKMKKKPTSYDLNGTHHVKGVNERYAQIAKQERKDSSRMID